MSNRIRELRGIIFTEFDSEAQFASALGWSRQRLSKITSGTKEPTVVELNEIAKGLNRSVNDLVQIFLRVKSPNGQLNVRKNRTNW